MTQRKNAPEPIKVVVTFTGDLALGLDHEASLTGENYPNFLRRILKAHLDREADALRIPLPSPEPKAEAGVITITLRQDVDGTPVIRFDGADDMTLAPIAAAFSVAMNALMDDAEAKTP